MQGADSDLCPDRLFALAELSFAFARKSQKSEYYLAAAVYAYAFLVPTDNAVALRPIDPRNRLAADLYNLGLTLGLTGADADEVIIETGTRQLPFGSLELAVDPNQFLWGGFRMNRFVPVAQFEVRGLRNRYRQAGIGAPLAAELTPTGEGKSAELARKRIPPGIRVPVTVFVRIKDVQQGIATGAVHGQIELYPADEATFVEVGGWKVPLELEPTATLAYMLEGAPIWNTEIGGFLSARRLLFRDGLVMLHPYQPGRIPVVLIHGTASSPARWAEMLNELQNDQVLRDRVQFWFFSYNTGNPILLSAKQLRESLRSALHDVDPANRDPSLHRMVLIGHSQGGLLARLMVTDSGDRFWDSVSRVPLADLQMTPEMRDLAETTMFFTPVPFVTRVVFIATPHRGSFRAAGFTLDVIRRLVTLPLTVVRGIGDVVQQNPDALPAALRTVPTAVENMNPRHRFIRTLSASPIAEGVTTHSIIAVLGEGPVSSSTDGVVTYESAHLDGVASEMIVRSGHSTQATPDTIEEVRRILREQVKDKLSD